MKTGFGLILCNLGSLLFLLMFHCKLHTIPENSLKVRLKKYLKFSLWCFLLGLSVLLQQIFYMYKVEEVEDEILIHHILYLYNLLFWNIFLPKGYINQNSALALYVKVYHHQPPPILPWQIPHNFDQRNVKLVIVRWKIEIIQQQKFWNRWGKIHVP